MRAGLSTILQTLTPEAASVLNLSIAEAGRRNHGQTTPLHVAATLLASPTGFLRQACIRSHPNSSHPLQCRALELCFSVALERLPTGQAAVSGVEPPISNALMAALKRAQAHQRRGCPEQQQQPLLAVKVELEQLIISILDDPSVSRVMREASFSSPAVKATIEQSLNSQPQNINPPPIGLGFRPNPNPVPIPSRNPYLNPRLQQGNSAQSGQQRNDEVLKIRDVLLRSKKKNPILVGESEPEAVIRELLRRIEKGEFGEGLLKSAQVIPIEKEITLDKTQIPTKIKELGAAIETRMGNSSGGGIILDLGDLKWLVEQQQPAGLGVPGSGAVHQQVVSEAGRAAVAEMAKLVVRFGDGGRLWLIGTATCETYLRCQVYHPTMETDWDLQAVPIASRSPLPGMFRRPGPHGILSSSVESLSPLKGFPKVTAALSRRASENSDPARRMSCCPQCTDSYEKELAKLVANVYEKSSSEVGSEVVAQSALPQWLQNAKALNGDTKTVDQSQTKDQEMVFKLKSQELLKKWADTCVHLHPNFHHNLGSERVGPTSVSMTGLYNPKLLVRQPLQQKLQQMKSLGEALQLNSNLAANQPSERAGSPPRSPVRTDLALGPTKASDNTAEKPHKDDVTDFLGCISPKLQPKFHGLQVEKFAKVADADSFKKLLKGLMEKVWWQQEAVSAVATTVTQFKFGSGKRRANGSRGDMWLLFTGPDRVGKKKIASVVSEQFCGTDPVLISLGSRRSDEELDMNFRGKTVLDRIAEAIRRNPFSVIMLENIDEADMLVCGSLKRAMDRGRLVDSHGREINLGNVIFVLTANWFPDNFKNLGDGRVLDENKLPSIATGGWQLRLSTGERRAKRRADWLYDESRPTKPRKDIGSGLSFDLNLAAEVEDDRTDGSHNSSDLTIEQEDDNGPQNSRFLITSVPYDLASSVDETIVFKPVQIVPIRRDIKRTITERFSSIVDGENMLIELEESALEKILAGVWLGRTSLDEWLDKALVPSFQQLKACLPSAMSADETVVVRLESDGNSGSRAAGDWLPSEVTVKVDT